MQQLFALSLGFGAVLFLAGQAQGADCARRDQVVMTLADRYGEAREAIGLTSDGAVIEVFASADGATWTIIATLASGMTCLLASGEHYDRLHEAPPPPGDPA